MTSIEVVSYRNSTSNHNSFRLLLPHWLLYLIEILHQTTTLYDRQWGSLKLYLIEILHQTTTKGYWTYPSDSCILSKFYIKPQHLGDTFADSRSCILSKFYIKPQLDTRGAYLSSVVSYRNSTSNHNAPAPLFFSAVVVSYRNSTSNHNCAIAFVNFVSVVSYRNSTSNHNPGQYQCVPFFVVSYRNSTSNHNQFRRGWAYEKLYLIEILHQTTTSLVAFGFLLCCILSKFYIKPQLEVVHRLQSRRCILSKFYIKPQRQNNN